MSELKPILTKLTAEEIDAILEEAGQALMSEAPNEVYNAICRKLPLSAWLADDLKKSIGIKGLVEGGCNLSKAVEAYGENWLEEFAPARETEMLGL